MGAWIEICYLQNIYSALYVAPLVGAWIEILIISPLSTDFFKSLLSWERGLKLTVDALLSNGARRSSRGSVD